MIIFSYVWVFCFCFNIIWIIRNPQYIRNAIKEEHLYIIDFKTLELISFFVSFFIAPLFSFWIIFFEIRAFFIIKITKLLLRRKISKIENKEIRNKFKDKINDV